MLSFIASMFGYVMKFIYDIVQNYGLSIILFTFLVKLILLPLTIKQQKSMEKMQEIQPLYQELQRKYGNDSQRLSMEYQKLLKEKNMNMASGMGCSGCLLQLIQLPIILGLFYMMMSPLTYILKLPKEQIDNYKQNLNTYYAMQAIESAKGSGEELTSAQISEYMSGDYLENSRYLELVIAKQENLFNMEFMGLNLGNSTSDNRADFQYYILPALCVLVTYLSLYVSSKDMKKKQNKEVKPNNDEKNLSNVQEEMPMPDMRMMNIMMPLMTGYIAYIAPQGLALYWTTNSLLQFIQMIALKKLKKSEKKEN
ncbi:MAG: membrane protein insertase YidC [Clostridia bacterium]|nr:membrane protein insertase YidC [Clostridia bacterium]